MRTLSLLMVSGVLAVAAPGCGDASQEQEGAAAIPESVQQSNQEMENFMQSQQPAQPK